MDFEQVKKVIAIFQNILIFWRVLVCCEYRHKLLYVIPQHMLSESLDFTAQM